MPLYAGHDGAQAKINKLYAGIGGSSKEIDFLYAGVNGTAKEVFVGVYRWKRYSINIVPALQLDESITYATWYEADAVQRYFFYVQSEDELVWYNTNHANGCRFTSGVADYKMFNSPTDYDGYYIAAWYDYDSSTSATKDGYASVALSTTISSGRATGVFKFNGTLEDNSGSSGKNARLYGEVYNIVEANAKGDYIETVYSKNVSDYPLNGTKDGYWYVYDGDITWNKYALNEIYEPSAYNSEESFSSSQSFPLLMASQAKKDNSGNVDWGATYSASSIANLRSNYSKYPFCSFASTLNADNLYKITTASVLSYKRQKVSAWSVTSQSAGSLVGSVTGKYGDYPENGIQDGYWYVMQEII